MQKQNKIFFHLGLLIIGIILTITGLMNIVKPVVKYVDYTEEQIKQKAKELGMVDLKEVIELNEESEKKQDLDSESKDVEKQEKNEENNEAIKESATVQNNEDSQTDEKDNTFEEYVLFEIHKGEKSEDIIDRLFEQGIIDDKERFIKLVAKKKVGRYFVYGSFELQKGMDYDTIIKILTGR